jgi:calcineurin-like phosphoesterase family protein
MVLFTSDLHIGHKNICKYRPVFSTAEEHDEYMFRKIEELDKRVLLIVLGDFVFDSPKYSEHIQRLRNVACRIRFVMGNHDSLKLLKEDFLEHREALASYKHMWLSHCPIHPSELRDKKGNIHGHLHSQIIDDPRYFNVNIENHNYEFVPLDTIKEAFNGCNENPTEV